ncbi:MAG: hypothetical protein WC295_03725 [Methanoregula sp.]|jgi:hypothetical protein
MKIQVGKGKSFQICLLVAILPVSAAGIAPVSSPGVLPDTQLGYFALPTKPGGLLI